MYEHYRQPLLSSFRFLIRAVKCFTLSMGMFLVTILIGAITYHHLEGLPWVDAIMNAVMIMTGLGVTVVFHTPQAKIFTSFYAIVSTLIFFAIVAILFSPLVHRFMHRFHLEIDQKRRGT